MYLFSLFDSSRWWNALILPYQFITHPILSQVTSTAQVYFVPWYSCVYPFLAPLVSTLSLSLQRLFSMLASCLTQTLPHSHTHMHTYKYPAIRLAPGGQNEADNVNRTCSEKWGREVASGGVAWGECGRVWGWVPFDLTKTMTQFRSKLFYSALKTP